VEQFWRKFQEQSARPKYVFGCNIYAKSILKVCSVDGFIDDFSVAPTFCGLPIIRSADIPGNALVLAASGGKPLTVRRKLNALGIEHLDYFSLSRWSGAPLREIVFNEAFCQEFLANEAEYQWAYNRLSDDLSRRIFRQLVSFRFTCDLDVMEGFSDRQQDQYFEDFLELRASGEIFVDVGGFDGQTTLEFIKRCPGYRAAYVFEPDPVNFPICVRRLTAHRDVQVWPIGASEAKGAASFATNGSASGVSSEGTLTVEMDRLDAVLPLAPTFVKMDIEGGESAAIGGAARIIREHHPRIALSVYHKPGDFWRLPKQVLGLCPDFDIYLRHYTESIYETVMFFMPKNMPKQQSPT